MSKPTEDIVRIVSFGGGVIVDASKPTEDLVRIASFMRENCTVIVRDAGRKPTEDLVRIASFAKGHIIFEL